jgi:hypothetical protein
LLLLPSFIAAVVRLVLKVACDLFQIVFIRLYFTMSENMNTTVIVPVVSAPKLSTHSSLTGLLLQRPSSMDLTRQKKRKRVDPTTTVTTTSTHNGRRAIAGPATLSLTASQSEPLFVLGESLINIKNSNSCLRSSSLHAGKASSGTPRNRQSFLIEGRPAIKVAPLSPAQYWKRALAQWNITIQPTRDQSYFLQATPERVQAYDRELLMAIRRQDLTQLQFMLDQGKLQHNACNAFGESLLHLACRKGMTQVVQFLVGTAKLSCWVHDDYGRTIAHDMCWTVQPNWCLVQFVLEHAPALLTLSDVRGHIALDYVPKSDWDVWLDFLAERIDHLKELLLLPSTITTNSNQQETRYYSCSGGEKDITATMATTLLEFATSAAARATIDAHESLHRLTDNDSSSCGGTSTSGSSATLNTIQEGQNED